MKRTLLLLAFIGAAACASHGDTCVDYAGQCVALGTCPAGSAQPTAAQFQAAQPDQNTAPYGCPASTNSAANGSAAVCCLPTDGG